MLGSLLNRLLLMVFGYVYPGYECYKTLESNKSEEIEQLLFWCQYWILTALLTICERFGDLFVAWLPLYGEAKVAVFIYLWHPRTRGAVRIYSIFLKPYVAEHEKEIDGCLGELKRRSMSAAAVLWQQVASYSQDKLFDILQYVSSVNAKVAQKSSSLPSPCNNVAGN